mmetsp:Transcript_68671/g.192513  ORF Transcript_68671/g.192513 Transcript_68671/m.192513 type:complete len:245 (-) Transcript_68671:236-970(-)
MNATTMRNFWVLKKRNKPMPMSLKSVSLSSNALPMSRQMAILPPRNLRMRRRMEVNLMEDMTLNSKPLRIASLLAWWSSKLKRGAAASSELSTVSFRFFFPQSRQAPTVVVTKRSSVRNETKAAKHIAMIDTAAASHKSQASHLPSFPWEPLKPTKHCRQIGFPPMSSGYSQALHAVMLHGAHKYGSTKGLTPGVCLLNSTQSASSATQLIMHGRSGNGTAYGQAPPVNSPHDLNVWFPRLTLT